MRLGVGETNADGRRRAESVDDFGLRRYARPTCLGTEGERMNVEDMILVSIDDHVIEPPGMFERHVPNGPGPVGRRGWLLTRQISSAAKSPRVKLRAPWGSTPWWDGRAMSGASIHQHLQRCVRVPTTCMNVFGTWIATGSWHQCVFPLSLLGFLGPSSRRVSDKEYRVGDDSCVQRLAYRRMGRVGSRGRCIPSAIPPAWDPVALADEVHRVARKRDVARFRCLNCRMFRACPAITT